MLFEISISCLKNAFWFWIFLTDYFDLELNFWPEKIYTTKLPQQQIKTTQHDSGKVLLILKIKNLTHIHAP